MWDAIRDVLTSTNATMILLFLMSVILIGVALFKTGLLNVHTKNVQIGASDKERSIIRNQIEWVKLHCEGLEGTIEKPENYNTWRGRYVAERVYDKYVDWITFNHISTSPTYIEVKQDQIVSLVNSLTDNPCFKTEEFERMLRQDTKDTIIKLVQIREVYEERD